MRVTLSRNLSLILLISVTVFLSCKKEETPKEPLVTAPVTDIDGNIYQTVSIGTQVWMKQNLKTTRYRDGSTIPTGLSKSLWQNTTTGAYTINGNNSTNDSTFGKLYNWFAVVDSRNLCPTGWHVPSDLEWKTLEAHLGMQGSDLDLEGQRGQALNVGGKMKSITGWDSPNTGATNSSDFSGIPGGLCDDYGTSFAISRSSYWWTSTENSTTTAFGRGLSYDYSGSSRGLNPKEAGFSVRCIKD
jgi:uncharacterized protein (TIGR02145 family)